MAVSTNGGRKNAFEETNLTEFGPISDVQSFSVLIAVLHVFTCSISGHWGCRAEIDPSTKSEIFAPQGLLHLNL